MCWRTEHWIEREKNKGMFFKSIDMVKPRKKKEISNSYNSYVDNSLNKNLQTLKKPNSYIKAGL
jgi:hypothetical protein